jgi:hypothetical protein
MPAIGDLGSFRQCSGDRLAVCAAAIA